MVCGRQERERREAEKVAAHAQDVQAARADADAHAKRCTELSHRLESSEEKLKRLQQELTEARTESESRHREAKAAAEKLERSEYEVRQLRARMQRHVATLAAAMQGLQSVVDDCA